MTDPDLSLLLDGAAIACAILFAYACSVTFQTAKIRAANARERMAIEETERLTQSRIAVGSFEGRGRVGLAGLRPDAAPGAFDD